MIIDYMINSSTTSHTAQKHCISIRPQFLITWIMDPADLNFWCFRIKLKFKNDKVLFSPMLGVIINNYKKIAIFPVQIP